jgi:lipopolysaccharide transport system permease protein
MKNQSNCEAADINKNRANLIRISADQKALNYWGDLWNQRQLLIFLVWRDLLVRYRQTIVGIAWVVLRPMLTMIIFSLVFGKLAGLSAGDKPYPLLVFAGMLPWFLFATAVSECTNSLSTNGALVGKIYFPRLIIPLSTITVSLVDYFVSCILIVGVMLWYSIAPSWRLLALPVLTFWVVSLAFGVGVWFAALTVRYRDLRHLVPFILQLGIYISPVGYSATLVPEKWLPLYSLNPMVGIINGYRWALLGNDINAYIPGVTLSFSITLIMVWTGILYFKKCEKTFVDFL